MKLFAIPLALGLMAFSGQAQQNPPAPDNTKVNKNKDPNADQAKNNTDDRTTMQKIRQSVMADKDLSTYAHNVKIIAKGGKVTLRGPVRSDAEKQTIEQKATEVAGAGNVTNEITIKPASTKTSTKKGTNN